MKLYLDDVYKKDCENKINYYKILYENNYTESLLNNEKNANNNYNYQIFIANNIKKYIPFKEMD